MEASVAAFKQKVIQSLLPSWLQDLSSLACTRDSQALENAYYLLLLSHCDISCWRAGEMSKILVSRMIT